MIGSNNFSRGMRFGGLMGVALMMGACGGSNDLVGFNRDVPDEFTVVTRAPLVMPPDINLRPPAAGARGPQDQASYDRARSAVFGAPSKNDGDLSSGENQLLTRAGADEIDPDNRPAMPQDNQSAVDKDESFIDSILFWRSGS
ncbi:MAG: DUF3035 domain-containing protein [Alphaproteobacteria bacterium]